METERNFTEVSQEQSKVLITGGTEGIGSGIAEAFLMGVGNMVAICARTQEKLDEMKVSHPEIVAERVDLADRHATKEFAQQAITNLGGIDSLILNASLFDFDFKNKSFDKDEIAKKIFQVNEVANVQLIRETREELKKSHGAIVFITTRFMFKDIETASTVNSHSVSAQEDIGRYFESKKRMHEYLKDFIKREENNEIFVFSVIPGTVNTPANRRLIEAGTPEMAAAKIKEKEDGKERDQKLVGKIIAEMTAKRKKFNPETNQYDLDIENGEVVEISNTAIEFEKEQKERREGGSPEEIENIKKLYL